MKATTGANFELDRDIAVATGLACRKSGDASVEWNHNGAESLFGKEFALTPRERRGLTGKGYGEERANEPA